MSEAVLSMDVEDWLHLDYIDRGSADSTYSMLDGVERYAELLESHGLRTTFFVLGELAASLTKTLQILHARGHEIASHGWGHARPLTLSTKDMREDLRTSRQALEDVIGGPVMGYRAPCFSLDRQRLEIVRECGYLYDASRIEFSAHPLYGTLDMTGFEEVRPAVFLRDSFCEFQVATLGLLGRQVPISGGGYLRIFPWVAMRPAIRQHLHSRSLYGFYIHPFELSRQPDPPFASNVRRRHRWRCSLGRATTVPKVDRLIGLLQQERYSITTYRDIYAKVVANAPPNSAIVAA